MIILKYFLSQVQCQKFCGEKFTHRNLTGALKMFKPVNSVIILLEMYLKGTIIEIVHRDMTQS